MTTTVTGRDELVLAALRTRAMSRRDLATATGIPYSSLYYILGRLKHANRVTDKRAIHAPERRARAGRAGDYMAIEVVK